MTTDYHSSQKAFLIQEGFLCLYHSHLNLFTETRVRFRTQQGTNAYNSLFFCKLCLVASKKRHTFATVKTNKMTVKQVGGLLDKTK